MNFNFHFELYLFISDSKNESVRIGKLIPYQSYEFVVTYQSNGIEAPFSQKVEARTKEGSEFSFLSLLIHKFIRYTYTLHRYYINFILWLKLNILLFTNPSSRSSRLNQFSRYE